MKDLYTLKSNLATDGFVTIPGIYTSQEIDTILDTINSANSENPNFKKSNGLFAIRQFLKEIPETKEPIFNSQLKNIISNLFGDHFFVVKSIYFDKPEQSNWFVSYHQDLTISVDKKLDIPQYTLWTVKQNQYAVQPPMAILNSIYTVRIHLDDTNEHNGALKVIPGSHKKEIYRPETIDWGKETKTTCDVEKGGIMIMRPLLLHSSERTTNHHKRRVIHIELSNEQLPSGLNWAEHLEIN